MIAAVEEVERWSRSCLNLTTSSLAVGVCPNLRDHVIRVLAKALQAAIVKWLIGSVFCSKSQEVYVLKVFIYLPSFGAIKFMRLRLESSIPLGTSKGDADFLLRLESSTLSPYPELLLVVVGREESNRGILDTAW